VADPDQIAQAYRHCENLVRANDKDRYLASLFAPAARRPYLHALYAFDVETARVRDAVSEPMAGMIRLQWWLEAVNVLRAGEAAASPVMIALLDASRATGVDLAPLAGAIEARQAELSGEPALGAIAAVMTMAARFLRVDSELLAAAAHDAAIAVLHTAEGGDAAAARAGYRAFCATLGQLPKEALPTFLPVALVPLRLKNPRAAQWRRQIALARAAYFGFPKL
jgi:phytoene/squalene synthetase